MIERNFVRDRLIEMLGEFPLWPSTMGERCMPEAVERLADHLLANGVVVPPVKVGDKVYLPSETDGECEPYVDEGTVFAVGVDEGGTMWISVRYESGLRYFYTDDELCKAVFLNREEAEKAL